MKSLDNTFLHVEFDEAHARLARIENRLTGERFQVTGDDLLVVADTFQVARGSAAPEAVAFGPVDEVENDARQTRSEALRSERVSFACRFRHCDVRIDYTLGGGHAFL